MSNFNFFVDHLLVGIAQTEARRFTRAREAFDQAQKLLFSDQQLPNLLLLLEHFARLEWLQYQDPKCVVHLSAVAAKRKELKFASEFPFDALVEKTLKEMRGEIAADVFEAFWQESRNRDPFELLQEFKKESAHLTAPGARSPESELICFISLTGNSRSQAIFM